MIVCSVSRRASLIIRVGYWLTIYDSWDSNKNFTQNIPPPDVNSEDILVIGLSIYHLLKCRYLLKREPVMTVIISYTFSVHYILSYLNGYMLSFPFAHMRKQIQRQGPWWSPLKACAGISLHSLLIPYPSLHSEPLLVETLSVVLEEGRPRCGKGRGRQGRVEADFSSKS